MKTSINDVMFGVIGGIAGTFVISQSMIAISNLQTEKDKRREQRLLQGHPTEKLAKKIGEGVLDRKLTTDEKSDWGQAIHWTYGTFWGAVYGVLRHRSPAAGRASGLPFGISLAVFGNMLLLPAAGLTPPAYEFPLSSHIRGMVSHCAYGATVEGTCRLLEVLEGAVAKQRPRTNTALRRVS